MTNNLLRIRITLMLDEQWASNQSREDLVDFIRSRFNNSLGFRGQIKEIAIERAKVRARRRGRRSAG